MDSSTGSGDSDNATDSAVALPVHPTAAPRGLESERHHQRQLLVVALIDRFCASYEQDPDRSHRLYLNVCKQLVRTGVRPRARGRTLHAPTGTHSLTLTHSLAHTHTRPRPNSQLVDSENVVEDPHLLQHTASQLFGRLIGQAIREVDDEVGVGGTAARGGGAQRRGDADRDERWCGARGGPPRRRPSGCRHPRPLPAPATHSSCAPRSHGPPAPPRGCYRVCRQCSRRKPASCPCRRAPASPAT